MFAMGQDQALGMLCHRLNNAFVRRMTLDFWADSLPVIYSLRANDKDLQCRLGTLHIGASYGQAIVYTLVDFLGVHLKPQIYEASFGGGDELSERVDHDYVLLFKHDALRGSVKHLEYEVSKTLFDWTDQFTEMNLPISVNIFF